MLLSLNALVTGEFTAFVLIGLAGMLLITKPWHWLDARVGPSGRNLRYGTAVVAMVVGVSLLPPPKPSVRKAQLSQPHHIVDAALIQPSRTMDGSLEVGA